MRKRTSTVSTLDRCRRKIGKGGPQSLAALVAAYLADEDNCTDEMSHYRSAPTWRESVRRAAFCERLKKDGRVVRHGHQPGNRFSKELLAQAFSELLHADLKGAKDFHDLLTRVEACIGDIRGIGELYVYDVSHRIGACLKPRLRPKFIYLHAGTRAGAKALCLDWRKDELEMSELPAAIRRLTPEQVEDFLCRCRDEFPSLKA